MNIIIHRGANQIGGCITEISTSQSKIIIDLGSNLPGCTQPDFTDDQIRSIVEGADAILYTHFHGDHVGFCAVVPEEIPQYIGAGAQDVMLCKYDVLKKHDDVEKAISTVKRMHNYEADKPMYFGDLKVTPYYCSHSAFDAYMFKIEWAGRVILHTGDFRKHGYMGKALLPMLRKYIGQVDVLITEGTMLSRSSELVKHESEIQQGSIDVLKSHKYVFALCSSTDIDRLASFHAACKATNRHFYVDTYQHSVLEAFSKYTTASIYDFGLDDTKFETTFKMHGGGIDNPNVVAHMKQRGFLLPIRCSAEWLVKKIKAIYTEEEPVLLYSMWDGYWKGTEEQRIPGVLAIRSLFKPENIIPMHTSGHADVATLAEVCETTHPRLAIIPIHKDQNSDFRSLKISDELKSKVVTESTNVADITIEVK